MEDEAGKTPDQVLGEKDFLQTPAAGLVAAGGFACLSTWGVYVVLAPAMPILSFLPVGDAVVCLAVSRIAAVVALILYALRPWAAFARLRTLIFPVMACAYIPLVVCSLLGCAGFNMPLSALCFAWALCGIGDVVLPFAWMVIISHMPPRQIAFSFVLGGILTTPLFLLIASAAIPAISILAGVLLLAASGLGAFVLFRQVDLTSSKEDICEPPRLSSKAMLSVSAHALVYGYMTIMLCSLDFGSVLIAGSAGIVSSCVAGVWFRNYSKRNWDTDTSQRMTAPIVVAAILMVPLAGDVGRTIGGALAMGAFSYVTLMEWTGTAVANAEFQFMPIARQAQGLLARWIGFLAGALLAFAAFFFSPADPMNLVTISSVLVVVVVTAFTLFDGEEKASAADLLDLVVSGDGDLVIDPPKNAAPFRERCDRIIEEGGLTQREGEVFRCLAKGRNAEYIQSKLFIGASTTRTHIFHIYRKLDINSQQQLIDLVDLQS